MITQQTDSIWKQIGLGFVMGNIIERNPRWVVEREVRRRQGKQRRILKEGSFWKAEINKRRPGTSNKKRPGTRNRNGEVGYGKQSQDTNPIKNKKLCNCRENCSSGLWTRRKHKTWERLGEVEEIHFWLLLSKIFFDCSFVLLWTRTTRENT